MSNAPDYVLVLNGPNLNRLGKRQPEVYGSTTLADIENDLTTVAQGYGATVDCRQSNSEAQLIEWVHEAADHHWPVIINAGGFTHTSVALRDALAEVADGAGYIEVHISNVHAREDFRHHSFLSANARGIIVGFGCAGYGMALSAVLGPTA
ncbi:type II 3-dehydroquinate dehydratase [Corynebacterium sp. TAE3-ERU12]|uniref:type II 3-dehydroquinate dehydratase n=1 Tax=Corynebacterium sp. TAE3-ERU12 TaxID=2849491 RepID=UPI001C444F99|nr:type II 3-dehydroquinate dehydratase [Corynebacterium sp. TAE3-ERU12]MBV7295380.1 type II 3-dehydroquinate dehydratase [Corynebacterium sp. TAE3-ERU12]